MRDVMRRLVERRAPQLVLETSARTHHRVSNIGTRCWMCLRIVSRSHLLIDRDHIWSAWLSPSGACPSVDIPGPRRYRGYAPTPASHAVRRRRGGALVIESTNGSPLIRDVEVQAVA